MNTFHNKVIWITGASSGIGEALSLAMAREGANLILSSRRTEELERVRNQCTSPSNRCSIHPFDLSDTSQIDQLTARILKEFGTIDYLINCGGISQRSYAKDTPIETDRKIMEVNFWGSVAVTKSVLPIMLEKKSGHIIVISSISGKFGFFLRSAYSASKHALHGFFESLRLEVFKDNIKVTLVCPGKINTSIAHNALNEKGEKSKSSAISSYRGLSPEECANQIIKAIKKNKAEVFIGGKELRAIAIKRLFPSLFFKLIQKQKVE